MFKELKEVFLDTPRNVIFAVIVAALGYFVDVFDIILFSVVRVQSLKDIGVPQDLILDKGVLLLNIQLIGLLIGGVVWGMLGDKLGRIQVLFGSILIYSVANILNAFVYSVESYVILRFVAGFGLAGEIGAGITLVSELLKKEHRGIGTTIVAAVGVAGALFAGIIVEYVSWRTAYIIGGLMGLSLLILRVSVNESGLFNSLKNDHSINKGSLKLLLLSKERLLRFIRCILIGTPIWFTVGIVVTFSPEIGTSLGIQESLKAGHSVIAYSLGISLGDLASGLLSQYLRSRKKVIFIFILLTLVTDGILLNLYNSSAMTFYVFCFLAGIFIGYWAVTITNAAEQFGTNLRATVATSTPNFIRGSAVVMTFFFQGLKHSFEVVNSAQIVGVVVFILALYSNYSMKETFGKDLNFLEK